MTITTQVFGFKVELKNIFYKVVLSLSILEELGNLYYEVIERSHKSQIGFDKNLVHPLANANKDCPDQLLLKLDFLLK